MMVHVVKNLLYNKLYIIYVKNARLSYSTFCIICYITNYTLFNVKNARLLFST